MIYLNNFLLDAKYFHVITAKIYFKSYAIHKPTEKMMIMFLHTESDYSINILNLN